MVIKMIFKKKDKIKKYKEIIKREQLKIKEEKRKNRLINKIISRKQKNTPITLKEQITSMIYFEILGFILCLLLFFALTGGRNYIKMYAELNKLINVYDTITSNYYGKIDKQAMIDNAIESMMSEAGDDYTNYTDKDNTTTFLENIDATYEGIGCTVSVNENNEIYVVDIFNDSPAKEAGIEKNDVILKIDDQDYIGKTSADMANYVKKNKNTKIKLLIRRNNEEKEITLTRKKVNIPTVTGEIFEKDNKKIGYINISVFSAQTYEQFRKELNKLEKKGIQGLIIDVRNNTGGYLATAKDISSMFLKKGDIIYRLEKDKKIEKIKDTTKESKDYPVAVIINAASASASEILASAIKESYKGIIVGTNSFGKGTVQKTKKLSDGSMIKYTVQKWLTPNGNWIDEVGVTPTNFVELRTANEVEITIGEDRQLETAKNLLFEKIN